ncbi:hypothetical protein KPH14_007521 [Odynerus spinipes]|uniref:Uncharacterized protein n=1 Tax=Odynerus spinipes TaxID=1348599 RepID=A0AAD9RHK4_9HYME|nr:hypothetical protein KPH14_007521 [Odynerus spinipes]
MKLFNGGRQRRTFFSAKQNFSVSTRPDARASPSSSGSPPPLLSPLPLRASSPGLFYIVVVSLAAVKPAAIKYSMLTSGLRYTGLSTREMRDPGREALTTS